jgi:hypothetical protein
LGRSSNDTRYFLALKDRDRNYSLNEFVARIEELKKNPKSSKAALRHQMKFGFEWNIFVFMNLILFSILIITLKWLPAAAIILSIATFANYKYLTFYFREKRYKEKLWKKLGGEEII